MALGGGAARGWAHVGVLRALDEAGVALGGIAGTSIGALVGAFYSAGKLDDLVDIGRELDRGKMVRLLDPVVPRSGLFNGDHFCELLRERLPVDTIEELPVPFAAVATDLATGEAVVFREGDLVEAVRASISIPGMFSPVLRDGRVLVDGGLVDPLPVGVARALGVRRVIGVDLTRSAERVRIGAGEDEDRVGGIDGANRAGGAVLEQALHRLWQQWHGKTEPRLLDVLGATVTVIQRSLTDARLETNAPDLLIQPELADVRLLDFHRVDETIDRGYQATVAAL